jgi:hypothetical protein
VVRQVAIDRSVYRPHTQQLEGRDVILRYLKRSPQFKGLAVGATQLLSEPASSPSCFDAVNGEWVPSVLAPSYIEQLKLQRKRAAQHTIRIQLLDLQAEVLRLKHGHAALLERVAVLEGQLGAVVEGAPIARPAAAPVTAAATKSSAADAPQTSSPANAPSASAGAMPTANADSKLSGAEPATAEAAPRSHKTHNISLPPTTDYVRCIEQLIGGDTTAKAVEDRVDFSQAALYLSVLIDDEDRVAGAILMDLKATVFLGGTLLMVPENELTQQVANNSPSEDSVAASSEVCSALSGSLNNVSGNPQLRSSLMEALEISKHSWLSTPASVTHLADSFGGKVMIAIR